MELFAYTPLLFILAGCVGMALSALSVYRLKRGNAIRIERGKPKRGIELETGW